MGWGPVESVGDQLTGWGGPPRTKIQKEMHLFFWNFWIRATVTKIFVKNRFYIVRPMGFENASFQLCGILSTWVAMKQPRRTTVEYEWIFSRSLPRAHCVLDLWSTTCCNAADRGSRCSIPSSAAALAHSAGWVISFPGGQGPLPAPSSG